LRWYGIIDSEDLTYSNHTIFREVIMKKEPDGHADKGPEKQKGPEFPTLPPWLALPMDYDHELLEARILWEHRRSMGWPGYDMKW
jgi:hypothetical protein